MSAITYPAGHRHQAPAAPFGKGLRRRITGWRPRRWDDRPTVERNASPRELATRSIPSTLSLHR